MGERSRPSSRASPPLDRDGNIPSLLSLDPGAKGSARGRTLQTIYLVGTAPAVMHQGKGHGADYALAAASLSKPGQEDDEKVLSVS